MTNTISTSFFWILLLEANEGLLLDRGVACATEGTGPSLGGFDLPKDSTPAAVLCLPGFDLA
jgi:hypothetical protein